MEGIETRESESRRSKVIDEVVDIESEDEKYNQSFWREKIFHGDRRNLISHISSH